MVCPSKVPTASRVIGGRRGTLLELIGSSLFEGWLVRKASSSPHKQPVAPVHEPWSVPWSVGTVQPVAALRARRSPWKVVGSQWGFRGTVRPRLAEGEGVRLDARVEEGDLEGPLGDRVGLADELVEPWFGKGAVALVVDVSAVGGSRRLPVDPHPEPDGSLWRGE